MRVMVPKGHVKIIYYIVKGVDLHCTLEYPKFAIEKNSIFRVNLVQIDGCASFVQFYNRIHNYAQEEEKCSKRE